jgi:hypothetical protein
VTGLEHSRATGRSPAFVRAVLLAATDAPPASRGYEGAGGVIGSERLASDASGEEKATPPMGARAPRGWADVDRDGFGYVINGSLTLAFLAHT